MSAACESIKLSDRIELSDLITLACDEIINFLDVFEVLRSDIANTVADAETAQPELAFGYTKDHVRTNLGLMDFIGIQIQASVEKFRKESAERLKADDKSE
jgi:hypothetical protein